MPLDIENGVAEVDVTGEHERVAALGKRFDEMGLEYELDRVRQRVDPVRLLTDRQQELLLTAVELGYYDVPRRFTLTEVADHVGIAKSTCSETLQRVERTVVREFVDDLPTRPTTRRRGDAAATVSDGGAALRNRRGIGSEPTNIPLMSDTPPRPDRRTDHRRDPRQLLVGEPRKATVRGRRRAGGPRRAGRHRPHDRGQPRQPGHAR